MTKMLIVDKSHADPKEYKEYKIYKTMAGTNYKDTMQN